MLAYDYPLMGIFWTTVVLAFWLILLYLLFWIFNDIFRSPDLGGLAKVLWMVFVILVPFVGVIAYVIVRGYEMSQRDFREAHERRLQSDAAGITNPSTSWHSL